MLIHSIAVNEKWRFVFLTSSDDTLFCFYFLYIFVRNYDFRSRNAIIPHREVIVLVYLHICIFVCMQATLCTVFLGFFLDHCDSSDVSERETVFFSIIYMEKRTCCHISTV